MLRQSLLIHAHASVFLGNKQRASPEDGMDEGVRLGSFVEWPSRSVQRGRPGNGRG